MIGNTEQMEATSHWYNFAWMPLAYDALSSLVWLPSLNKLREAVLDLLGVSQGKRVLELGCGTGGFTAHLVRRGAIVTSVDQSEYMLRRACKRASAARFIQGNILQFDSPDKFDRILLAFVLHEMNSTARLTALKAGARLLTPDGVLGIVDFDAAANRLTGKIWRKVIRLWEPATVLEIIDNGFQSEMEQAGLVLVEKHALAGGRAQIILAKLSGEAFGTMA